MAEKHALGYIIFYSIFFQPKLKCPINTFNFFLEGIICVSSSLNDIKILLVFLKPIFNISQIFKEKLLVRIA
jgi:hypothetical protein